MDRRAYVCSPLHTDMQEFSEHENPLHSSPHKKIGAFRTDNQHLILKWWGSVSISKGQVVVSVSDCNTQQRSLEECHQSNKRRTSMELILPSCRT